MEHRVAPTNRVVGPFEALDVSLHQLHVRQVSQVLAPAGREGIEDADIVPTLEKSLGEVGSDEPTPTGYKHAHAA